MSTIKEEAIKLRENIDAVYEAGFSAGQSAGGSDQYDAGFSAGQQSEYDRFWDSFQQNGKRTVYKRAFAGAGWKADTLKIKYPIVFKPQAFSNINQGLFEQCNWQSPQIDFTEICSMIDFSQYPTADSLFSDASAINITCDFSSCTNLSYTFATGNGGILNNITIKVSDLCTKYSYTFYYNTYLKNLTFVEGSVIAATLDLSYSNLTVASMKSVINALKNFTGTDKEFTYQIKFKPACWEALEADSTSPTGTTWAEYVQDTLCWNI